MNVDRILIPEDKANHAVYGQAFFMLLVRVLETLNTLEAKYVAFGITLAVAIAWEVVRQYWLDYKIDPLDIAASVSLPLLSVVLESV